MRADKGFIAVLLLLALLVVPRVVALDADTLPSLCWNSGIWTDEGFYTYNARNAVLFGRPELDEFNNRTLSPVLDAVQRAVFGRFGVGLVQARAISVACALLALAFFYAAMRRAFGARVGVTALVLLGGEVTFILYNRLALMETPSVLVLCAALWALTLGTPLGWLLAGALAAGTIAFKTTFLVFLPVPLLAWLWRRVERGPGVRRPVAWYAAGVALGALAYLALWGIPHGREVWRMNNFYRTYQSQPRSAPQAARLVRRAVLGRRMGMLQYLETRTPVLTTLMLVGLLAAPAGRRGRGLTARAARRRDMLRVLWLWVALGLFALAASRYSPSRYYLVIYPGIAGLAALALWRLAPLWRRLRERGGAGRIVALVGVPAFFLAYHLLLPGTYALPATRAHFGLTAQIAAAFVAGTLVYAAVRRLPPAPHPRALAAGVLALFLAVSLGQWGHWYVTRGYRTRDLAAHFARLVKPGEVLAGDWAPNLCLENQVRAVPVLPKLANWRDPVRQLQANYVLVTQTRYPMRFWQKTAPEVVRPENLVETIRLHEYRINLYRVPPRARALARGAPSGREPPQRKRARDGAG